MANKRSDKKRFNFMDLIIIAVTFAFIGAAVYFIVRGITGEKKSYTVAYTVKLELDAADADKISEGDNVLSSDGLTVIGTVRSIRKEKKAEYVIDRRLTAPSEETTKTDVAAEAATTTTAAPTGSETQNGSFLTETLTSGTVSETSAAPVVQTVIITGKDYGLRDGELISYRESDNKIIVYVTVIADVKASDNAYVVNGERIKIGKTAEFLTPYFFAVGEYHDIASAN